MARLPHRGVLSRILWGALLVACPAALAGIVGDLNIAIGASIDVVGSHDTVLGDGNRVASCNETVVIGVENAVEAGDAGSCDETVAIGSRLLVGGDTAMAIGSADVNLTVSRGGGITVGGIDLTGALSQLRAQMNALNATVHARVGEGCGCDRLRQLYDQLGCCAA